MKILVISDTHIPITADKIPEEVLREAESSDLIIHAGDIVDMRVIEDLKKIKPVVAVAGNMDSLQTKIALGNKKILTLQGFKVGIIHGWGPALGLVERISGEFKNKNVACVIYGHSHRANIQIIGDVIYFNPGSLSDPVTSGYRSYGLINIDNSINAHIVKI